MAKSGPADAYGIDTEIYRDQSRAMTMAYQTIRVKTERLLRDFVFLISLFFMASTVAAAGTNDADMPSYLPYLNGRPWPQIPTVKFVETRSNIWVHPTDANKYPTVQEIAEPNADFATVIIRRPDGIVYKTYNARLLGPYLCGVYMGDFNNDGIPDFMAIKPGCGCGLAGDYRIGVFAFSDGQDYQFSRIWTMDLGPENLVIDPKTKGFRLIHTSFRSALGPDGRYHSFWVHRFFKWEFSRFDEDANLQPIWIQYLFRSNHEPTKMLTSTVKTKAWADDPESQAKINW